MASSDDWRPKFADIRVRPRDGSAEQRFEEAGFSLFLTLQQQSPLAGGDKNNERKHPPLSSGETTMEPPQNETPRATSPQQVIEEAARGTLPTGIGYPFPMQITLSPELTNGLFSTMRAGARPVPFGQEMARFATKAVIGGAVALVAGVTYHWITAPPTMPTM